MPGPVQLFAIDAECSIDGCAAAPTRVAVSVQPPAIVVVWVCEAHVSKLGGHFASRNARVATFDTHVAILRSDIQSALEQLDEVLECETTTSIYLPTFYSRVQSTRAALQGALVDADQRAELVGPAMPSLLRDVTSTAIVGVRSAAGEAMAKACNTTERLQILDRLGHALERIVLAVSRADS